MNFWPVQDPMDPATTNEQEGGTLSPTLSLVELIGLLEALAPELEVVSGSFRWRDA